MQILYAHAAEVCLLEHYLSTRMGPIEIYRAGRVHSIVAYAFMPLCLGKPALLSFTQDNSHADLFVTGQHPVPSHFCQG